MNKPTSSPAPALMPLSHCGPFSDFKSRFGGLALIALVLAILPFILPNSFYYDAAIRMAMNAIVVIGLNLLVGYAGQISLGHAGFFGIGAYASGILTARFSWSPMLALLAGACACALLAVLIARPILRLKGHYLAIATLGIGIIVSIVIGNETAYTGGSEGMPVQAFSLFGFEIAGDRMWLLLVSFLLIVVVACAINLVNSPAGRALQAIHGSEVAASVVGIDAASFKTRVFILSAVLASIMGSFSAHYVGFITPGVAGFMHSIELVTMVVVGGMASVYGSVVGAVLLSVLPQLLAKFEGWEIIAYGAILIFIMVFMPKGLVPTLADRFRKGGS